MISYSNKKADRVNRSLEVEIRDAYKFGDEPCTDMLNGLSVFECYGKKLHFFRKDMQVVKADRL
jgi:hypothetical protein